MNTCLNGARLECGDFAQHSKETLDSFNEHGHPHAARDAERGKPKPPTATLKLVNERGHNSRAGAAYRMTQSDCAAVYVQPVVIEM